MNILPKKSWHVRTKKNIERVRRDEANAAEEEKKLKRRIQLAEQEARTELLRKRAKADYVKNDDNLGAPNQHINFFQEIEDVGKFTGGNNKEHEEEKKAIQEKLEKDFGFLTYLGQSSIEARGEIPWYLKVGSKYLPRKKSSKPPNFTSSKEEEEEESPNTRHKNFADPLKDMKKHLTVKQKKHGEKELFIFKKDEEKKKEKPKIKEGPKVASKLSKIEELRAKRLKREAEERKRSQQFLEGFRRGSVEPQAEVILDDRARKYNSQFNPHLARNNNASGRDCR